MNDRFPWWVLAPVVILLSGAMLIGVKNGWSGDQPPSDFNGNQQLWLRSVAGDNSPRDATPDEPISNVFTACLDGDLYVAGYSPGVGVDPNYVSLDVTYDYENWCPDDASSDHNPFEEDS